jgi:hypothetical protein
VDKRARFEAGFRLAGRPAAVVTQWPPAADDGTGQFSGYESLVVAGRPA